MSKKFFLLILSTFLGVFLFANSVLAKTNTADLGASASSSYTYDNTKIEFSGGTVRLKATTNWYNNSWGYRDRLTITNDGGGDLTNYQVPINLTSTSVDFWSHIESSGDSIRFTDSDGTTLLNHYVESFNYSAQTSSLWVKIPSLLARSTTTIYLYYGNSGASSVSDSNSVFERSEEFTTSIDANKWATVGAQSVYSVSSSQLLADANAGHDNVWDGMYMKTAYSVTSTQGLVFETDLNTFNVANRDQNIIIGLKNTSTESVATFYGNMPYSFYLGGGNLVSSCSNGLTSCVTSNIGLQTNTDYKLRIIVYPAGGADYFIKGGLYLNWTFINRTSYTYTGQMVMALTKQEAKYTIDNMRIRKITMNSSETSNFFPRYSTTTPVFTSTTPGNWEGGAPVAEMDVMYEDGIFKMWYSASTSIGYATSTNGITWTRYSGNPVFSPSGVLSTFDKTYANRQFIYKDGGIYYMYYNGFETNQSGTGKIGLATSSDGITWNRYSSNPVLSPGAGWEDFSLYNTAVVKVGSIWYMLYEGKGNAAGDNTQIIGLATSTNGINWNKYTSNPIIRKGFAYSTNYAAAPNLIYNNGKFYIWIMDSDHRGRWSLIRSQSTDAINWSFADTKEIYPQYGWEYTSISDASNPIEVSGSVYMYYITGNQVGLSGGIGLMKYTGTLNSLLNSSTPFTDATQTLSATSSLYSTTRPSLTSPGIAYDKITAFNATSTGSGSVVYQISNNGSTWYYWNGTTWASASNSSQSNSSTVINTNITAFSNAYPSGTFYWKAFFVSDGTQSSSLSNLSSVTNILPTITIDTISGYKTTSTTVNYRVIDPDQDTVNFSQTATSGVEYSLNGSTWQDATASTTGDGLTGLSSTSSPGQAHTFVWDTITDASTTESNTVYLRFRANDGLDFGSSWTTSSLFGVDNVAPSGVGAPTFGTIASTSIEVVKPSVVTESGSGLNQWQVRRDATTTESAISTSTNSLTVNNLTPNTAYSFDVRFTDMVTNTSAFGASTTQYTNAALPVSPVISSLSTSTLSISWGANNNPTSTVYQISAVGFTSVTTTATTSAITGLTPNTSYTFTVKARNQDTSYNAGMAALVTTTLANVPLSVVASVESQSQITISWSGDATNYYVENITASTSSDWQSSTQKTFSNLVCDTRYIFRVKGRNSGQVNTDWSSEVGAKTPGCGSLVSVASPSIPVFASAVTLSNQQTVTDSSSVILSVSAQNAKQMAISNDPGFVGISWESYNNTKKWNLLPGSGQKTIYVKFRSAEGGVSGIYKFNLLLSEQNSKPVQNTALSQGPVIQESVKSNLNLNIKNPDQYKAGAILQLSYQYTNASKNTAKIKVTRELLDSKNKVIKLSNGKATLKPGRSFTNNTKEKLPTNLKVGNYSVRVRIYNQQTGKLIAQDLQSLKVIKKK